MAFCRSEGSLQPVVESELQQQQQRLRQQQRQQQLQEQKQQQQLHQQGRLVCIECGAPVDCIYRAFPPGSDNIRLACCNNCGKLTDPYVQHDALLLCLDLLLHKPQVYRHLLYNRHPQTRGKVPPSIIKFTVACIFFDAYLKWFLLHSPQQQQHEQQHHQHEQQHHQHEQQKQQQQRQRSADASSSSSSSSSSLVCEPQHLEQVDAADVATELQHQRRRRQQQGCGCSWIKQCVPRLSILSLLTCGMLAALCPCKDYSSSSSSPMCRCHVDMGLRQQLLLQHFPEAAGAPNLLKLVGCVNPFWCSSRNSSSSSSTNNLQTIPRQNECDQQQPRHQQQHQQEMEEEEEEEENDDDDYDYDDEDDDEGDWNSAAWGVPGSASDEQMLRWLLSRSTAAIEQQLLVLLFAASELAAFLLTAVLLTRLYVACRHHKTPTFAAAPAATTAILPAGKPAAAAATGQETAAGEEKFELGVLLTALGLSLYSKLGSLLVMAWHEALLLRHCVALFTFSSNVVALNVFLHPSSPAAGLLIAAAATAAKAGVRAASSVLLQQTFSPAAASAAAGESYVDRFIKLFC